MARTTSTLLGLLTLALLALWLAPVANAEDSVTAELKAATERYGALAAKQPPDYLAMLDVLYSWKARAEGPLADQVNAAAVELGLATQGQSFASGLQNVMTDVYRQAAGQIVTDYNALVAADKHLEAARYARTLREWLDAHPTVKADFCRAIDVRAGRLNFVLIVSEAQNYQSGMRDLVTKCLEQSRKLTSTSDLAGAQGVQKLASDWLAAVADLRQKDPREYRALSRQLQCGDAVRFVEGLVAFNDLVVKYRAAMDAGRFEEARQIVAEGQAFIKAEPVLAVDLSRALLKADGTLADLQAWVDSGTPSAYLGEFRRDQAQWADYMKGGRYDLAQKLVTKWRQLTAANPGLEAYLEQNLPCDDLDKAFQSANQLAQDARRNLTGRNGKYDEFMRDYADALRMLDTYHQAQSAGNLRLATWAGQKLISAVTKWVRWADANPELALLLGPLVGGDFTKLREGLGGFVDDMVQFTSAQMAAHPDQIPDLYRQWDTWLAAHADEAALIEEVTGNDELAEDIHAAAYPTEAAAAPAATATPQPDGATPADDDDEGDRQTDTTHGFVSGQ